MTIHSKTTITNTFAVLSFALVFVFFLSTQTVHAQERTPQITTTNFCNQLKDVQTHIGNEIKQKQLKFEATRREQTKDWQRGISEKDSHIAQSRTRWDENRTLQFDALQAKAQTDQEKKAIQTFKISIDDAITRRRTAVDTALTTYRNSINSLLVSNQPDIDSAVSEYKDAINFAQARAETSCENGEESSQVRDSFRNDLQSAKTKLDSRGSGLGKFKQRADTVTKQPNNFEANTEFRKTLLQAQSSLQSALKQ